MEYKKELKQALLELRKDKERKFNQTVDLIINLKKFDVKKNQLNLLLKVPHKVKEKKIAAFFETENKHIYTITGDQFKHYRDKKELKKLVDKFDFFIAEAKLMPKVATTFGRILGPAGKMPSPQLGIIMNADEKSIKEIKSKVDNSVKIKTTEPSIKVAIGKQSLKDEEIIENVMAVYKAVEKSLVRGQDNVKNVEIKFTMTKPIKIQLR